MRRLAEAHEADHRSVNFHLDLSIFDPAMSSAASSRRRRPTAELVAGFGRILAGCAALVRPGGVVAVTVRPFRVAGELVDLPGQIIGKAEERGLVLVDGFAALLCGLRGGRVVSRASFFQMVEARRRRAGGIPAMPIAHEDLLVFQVRGRVVVSAGEVAGLDLQGGGAVVSGPVGRLPDRRACQVTGVPMGGPDERVRGAGEAPELVWRMVAAPWSVQTRVARAQALVIKEVLEWWSTQAFRDHPRVRGADTVEMTPAEHDQGPSPRARGRHPHPRRSCGRVRTIPACAGPTGVSTGSGSSPADHPRVRGADASNTRSSAAADGPSPRARGRHVRADVEVGVQLDHPRVRGADTS